LRPLANTAPRGAQLVIYEPSPFAS
jgi:hypothetical protein